MEMKDRLLKARVNKGYSQRKLAEVSGVSRPQIGNMETGRAKNVKPEIITKLAEALDTTDLAITGSGVAKVLHGEIIYSVEALGVWDIDGKNSELRQRFLNVIAKTEHAAMSVVQTFGHNICITSINAIGSIDTK